MERSKLMDAFHHYKVNYLEYMDKAKILDGTTGEERERLQNWLADWITETYPLRVRIPPEREMTESERNAVNLVFGDSTWGTLLQARSDYEALESSFVISLAASDMHIGRINEPEESDYRKIVPWRLSHPDDYDVTNAELIGKGERSGWKGFIQCKEQGNSFRIWYSENPKELCGFYYLCSLLKNYTGDVYAVRVPERIRFQEDGEYRFAYETANLDSDLLGRIVETGVKLSSEEIGLYAEEWERLKQENALLRTVIAGKIVSVPLDFYDPLIFWFVPEEPATEESVFTDAIINMPYVEESWIITRIQKMIDDGQIKVVKDDDDPENRMICKNKPEK